MGCENVASKKNQLECVQAGCDFAFVDCPFKYFPSRISFFFFFFFTEKHNSDTKEPPFIIHLNQSKLSVFFAEITVRAQLYCQTRKCTSMKLLP